MKTLFLILAFTSATVAQAPTLNGKLITGGSPLSIRLNWTSVTNAIYSVYEAPWNTVLYDCPVPTSTQWVELASGLTATTYTDTPTDQNAPRCYAVTATVGGAEGPQSNAEGFVLRNHAYFYMPYRASDCVTKVNVNSVNTFVLTQTLDGVKTTIPVSPYQGDAWSFYFRVYDSATYTFDVTFADGDHFVFPVEFAHGSMAASAVRNTTIFMPKVRNTNPINPGLVCSVKVDNNYQPASIN